MFRWCLAPAIVVFGGQAVGQPDRRTAPLKVIQEEDYRRLALDSSNLLMEWDGRLALGQTDKAVLAVYRAGELREQMGRIRCDAGDYAHAAEDWLSSSACFVGAEAGARANAALQSARDAEIRG